MSELSTLRKIRKLAEQLLNALDRQSPRLGTSLNVDEARAGLRALVPATPTDPNDLQRPVRKKP